MTERHEDYFCESCPIGEVDIKETQIREANRFVNFEIEQQRLIAADQYNRFVDGVIFDGQCDSRLSNQQKAATRECAAKRICGECIEFEPK